MFVLSVVESIALQGKSAENQLITASYIAKSLLSEAKKTKICTLELALEVWENKSTVFKLNNNLRIACGVSFE